LALESALTWSDLLTELIKLCDFLYKMSDAFRNGLLIGTIFGAISGLHSLLVSFRVWKKTTIDMRRGTLHFRFRPERYIFHFFCPASPWL